MILDMEQMKRLTIACVAFAFAAASGVSLDGEWKLECLDEEDGHVVLTTSATVPGETLGALERAEIVPDPTIGTNVWGLFEWERRDWRYSRRFKKVAMEPGERAVLRFDGVDTRAEYSLNGEKIGSSSNMFVPTEFDITEQMKDDNVLEVVLRSPLRDPNDPLGVLGRSRMGGTDVEGIRKAQHSFGWDIMPRVVTCGIWKSVTVSSVPPVRIADVHWMTVEADPELHTATVNVDCRIVAPRKLLHVSTLRLTLSRPGAKLDALEHPLRFFQTRDTMKLEDIALWWPHGAGEAAIYDATAELIGPDGMVLARDSRKIGLRTIRLERADWHSEEAPGTFRFIVNGKPIYMHGCNWTPMDALHSRDSQHLRKCLDMLVDLNCNMIRIWGGGVYEPDALYEFCDRNGILVWQDFMMGNVEPEQNDRFAKAIEEEARYEVLRLRSHPCLAMWCGNNEQDRSVGQTWGKYAPDPEKERISREVLPRVLRDFDPFTPYIPSSPWWTPDVVAGRAKLSQDHLWGPRQKYFKEAYWCANTPTFVSETGYHGCPNVETLKRMMTPDCVYPWPDKTDKCSFNFQWQCKATIAYPEQGGDIGNERNSLMSMQTANFFGKTPDRLEDFAMASQHVQAEALKTWIELSRSRKGRTWGLLWWNLRDGWPILSDGVVDWYFGKKQAYSAIRQSSKDELVMIRDDKKVIAVNDRFHKVSGEVKISDNITRNVVLHRRYEVAANAVSVIGEIAWSGQGVFDIEYHVDGEVCRNYYLYGAPPFDFDRISPILKNVREAQ